MLTLSALGVNEAFSGFHVCKGMSLEVCNLKCGVFFDAGVVYFYLLLMKEQWGLQVLFCSITHGLFYISALLCSLFISLGVFTGLEMYRSIDLLVSRVYVCTHSLCVLNLNELGCSWRHDYSRPTLVLLFFVWLPPGRQSYITQEFEVEGGFQLYSMARRQPIVFTLV